MTWTPIPTGKFNTSYFVHTDAGEFVLRIAPPPDSVFVFYERDMMRQEPGIHSLLLRETSAPVARIVGHDDSHAIVDRDYLLMERLPGRPLCEMASVDEPAVLAEVGSCLARVHKLAAPHYGYLGPHRPMPPQASWVEAFQMMWRKLIDDVVVTGHYTSAERDAFLRLLDRHLPLFDRPIPACLLHMDIWGQNILVSEEGRLTGLVDWDRALWGDPEIEFAVLDYCGISTPAFWEGYGRPRDTSREAAIRQVFYLLYEIQKYIIIEHGRKHNPSAARQYQRYVMQLARRIP
jgi:aminoglycoside phosphotransferase (APT) family kinase protein